MCSKQITLLCKFVYDWKSVILIKAVNFTRMFVLYSDISFYYTSREFPIQNFHRRTTDIL